MKLIKKIFYGICILLILGCAGVLFCALNPSVTDSLAHALYAGEGPEGPGKNNVTPVTDTDTVPSVPPVSTDGIAGGTVAAPDEIPAGLQPGNILYELPSDVVVTLPEGMDIRTGYEPVRDEGRQVEDKEADSLKDSLPVGETGNDLTFDAEFYPYYAMLEPGMQKIYRQIYANIMKGNISFAPVTDVNVNQLKNVFEAVFNDHPELFWVETGYSCKYVQSGKCVEISLQYYPIANNLENAKAAFEGRAQTIINGARELEDVYEQEKYVHNAVMSLAEYDSGASMNQSAYSAMVEGRSVCAGYARAFQYIMQQMGIPCYYCTGYSGEDHAWNIVKLSDDYYNVDVTWDDTVPATYDYFNKSDNDFGPTHVRRGLSLYLPACQGGAYSGRETKIPFPVAVKEVTDPVETPKPQPMVWEDKDTVDKEEEALRRAGFTKDDVLNNIEEYYADCLAQMKKVGSGQEQFVNVVPEVLWIVIEREYTDGRYETGYVDQALKDLKMDYFAIQLQAQKLGDGYYKLYHNVSTWR